MRHVSLQDTRDTPSPTPAHTRLLEHTPPYNIPRCLVLSGSGMRPVAYGPHWPCLPPPASPAPTSLACPLRSRLPPPALPAPIGLDSPHGEEEGSALVLGIGLQLWQSALGFPSLPFIYQSIVLSSLWIDRQLSFFILSHLHSMIASVTYHYTALGCGRHHW